jgi:hypothetical protein
MIRRTAVLALLVSSAVLFTGCATVPAPEAMRAEIAGFSLPKKPESGQAMVYVVRPSSLGALIRFNVFLNDQEPKSEVGYTRGGQHIFFAVPPGTHRILSKAENWAEVQVTLKAGEVAFIQQDPSMGVIMARNTLLVVDEVTGTYQVKKTNLGTLLPAEKK